MTFWLTGELGLLIRMIKGCKRTPVVSEHSSRGYIALSLDLVVHETCKLDFDAVFGGLFSQSGRQHACF